MSDTPSDNSDELDPLTRESLQAELKRYQDAYKQEFDIAQAEKPENVIDNTLEFFQKNVSVAAAQIVWQAQNSTSDATRLAASKYIIERVFKGAVDSTNDPIREILKGLMVTEPTATTE